MQYRSQPPAEPRQHKSYLILIIVIISATNTILIYSQLTGENQDKSQTESYSLSRPATHHQHKLSVVRSEHVQTFKSLNLISNITRQC